MSKRDGIPESERELEQSQADAVRDVIDHHLSSIVDDDSSMMLGEIDIVTDEETTEEFFEVVLVADPRAFDGPDDLFDDAAPATIASFARFVDEGFDYPMEVVVFIDRPEAPAIPAIGYRVAVQWVREHIHDNLTLEQLCGMVYKNIQQPDSPEDAEDWVPEYPLDWRAMEEPPDIGAGVSFDYWTSGTVEYPGETDE